MSFPKKGTIPIFEDSKNIKKTAITMAIENPNEMTFFEMEHHFPAISKNVI